MPGWCSPTGMTSRRCRAPRCSLRCWGGRRRGSRVQYLQADGDRAVAHHPDHLADSLGDRGGVRPPDDGVHLCGGQRTDNVEREVGRRLPGAYHDPHAGRGVLEGEQLPGAALRHRHRGREEAAAAAHQRQQRRRLGWRQVVDVGRRVAQRCERPCPAHRELQAACRERGLRRKWNGGGEGEQDHDRRRLHSSHGGTGESRRGSVLVSGYGTTTRAPVAPQVRPTRSANACRFAASSTKSANLV